MQLRIEREALKKRTTRRAIGSRRSKNLADLKEEGDALRSKWDQGREAIQSISDLRQQIDETSRSRAGAARI
ncbi:MAG: hypothetical protein R2843_14440 [Thermomicrobiales bacterium]